MKKTIKTIAFLMVFCMLMTALPFAPVSYAAIGISYSESTHTEPGAGAITGVTATPTEIVINGWIRMII